MNERIRELAEQAGYKPLPGFDFANSLEEVFIKKFAELIVRECMTVCQKIDKEYDGEDVLATWCATEIGKHFGVEE
jgi:hypothetical protein